VLKTHSFIIIMSIVGFIDMDFFECQVWSHLYPELAKSPYLLVYEPSSQTLLASTFTLTSKDPDVCLKRPVPIQKVLNYCNINSEDIKCFAVPVDRSTGKSASPAAKKKAMLEIEKSLRSFVKSEFGDAQDVLNFSKNDDDISVDLGKLISQASGESQDCTNVLISHGSVNWIGGKGAGSSHDKMAGEIMGKLLNHLKMDVRFQASAGIGPSLIVAKLAREFNKPGGITIVPSSQVDLLYSQINLKSAPELKGTCGHILSTEICIPESDQFLTSLFDLRKLSETFENAREMHLRIFKKYPARLLGLEKCHRLWHLAKGTDCSDQCCEIRPHSKQSRMKSCAIMSITAPETLNKSVHDFVTTGTYRLFSDIETDGTPLAISEYIQRYLKSAHADLLIVQSSTNRICFSVKVDAGEIEGDYCTEMIKKLSQRLEDKLLGFRVRVFREKSLEPNKVQYTIEKLTMRAKLLTMRSYSNKCTS